MTSTIIDQIKAGATFSVSKTSSAGHSFTAWIEDEDGLVKTESGPTVQAAIRNLTSRIDGEDEQ